MTRSTPVYCQDPSDKLDYVVDFEPHLANDWQESTTYSTNNRIRPIPGNGFEYECTTAGRTGSRQPRWPTTVAQTVADGSVIWTARAITTGSLKTTLSSAAWSAETGITVSGVSTSGQRSAANIEGGIDGQTYLVTVIGSMADGTKRTVRFRLDIKERTDYP